MKKAIDNKKIEIFCGTGGVGKTTLATSRALYLAQKGLKILIITIDPSKRLKQILGLKVTDMGKIKKIESSVFNKRSNAKIFTFDALLMAPIETLKFIGKINKISTDYQNPILKTLMRPYGGLNEIMSIVELSRHLKADKYDTIILDTPPGKNFIDFLEAGKKINNFFDKSFIDVFKYIKTPANKNKGLFASIVSGGISKLIEYLEKVTGEIFVSHFVDAIISLYKGKDTFIEALSIQQMLQDPSLSNWFLVTSIEQQKISDALDIKQHSKSYMHNNSFLTINKSLTPFLKNWKITSSDNENLINLRKIMIERENQFKDLGKNGFQDVIIFPEVLHDSPEKHVHDLNKAWIQ